MAVAVEPSENGDRVVRHALAAVRMCERTDFSKALAAYPLDEVEQVNADVEDDAAL
jgi:hypothetical protein